MLIGSLKLLLLVFHLDGVWGAYIRAKSVSGSRGAYFKRIRGVSSRLREQLACLVGGDHMAVHE